jgi:hypothetical protein
MSMPRDMDRCKINLKARTGLHIVYIAAQEYKHMD